MNYPVLVRATFEHLVETLAAACRRCYGDRLVSLLVYGSVGRGVPGPNSDIDVLIVAEPLPDGRTARVAEFDAIERDMTAPLKAARVEGVNAWLSPVFKTPDEVALGSLLFLGMIDDGRIVSDRDGFMRNALLAFKARLDGLGARRVWRGNAWYWDLKPDYKPGEVFEI